MREGTDKSPKMSENNGSLGLKLREVGKTPSQWAQLAQEAEKEERWSDAHYCWMAGSVANTRNSKKAKEMQLNAFQIFGKWQETI